MMDFMFDPEALKKEQEAQASAKQGSALVGGIADILAGGNSAGNYMLGKTNQQGNAGRQMAQAMAESQIDPIKRQADLYARYKESKQAKAMQDEEAKLAKLKDPNSSQTKALRSLAMNLGIEGYDKMSGEELSQFINPQRMAEMKVQQANQMALRRMDLAEAGQRASLAKQEKLDELARKKGEDEKSRMTSAGLARTDMDAKDIKEATENKKDFDEKISELISLREKYGAEVFNRDAVARGKQLSKDLLLLKKNLAKLGVLSKSDEDIVNAIIPSNPLGFDVGQVAGQDPIMTQLTKFRDDIGKSYGAKLSERLERPPEWAAAGRSGPTGQPSLLPQASASGQSQVRVQAPDGSVRLIPKEKVDAAIKAGGKVL